jgi:hypothetical protein
MGDENESFHTEADSRDLLRLEDKRRFQKLFTQHAVRSYLFLSFGMGIVSLALPIALLLAGSYHDNYSISHFYYDANDACRNILVGCLWATGIFLFLFHGLSSLENWILNLAGVAAISVAMNPMGRDQCDGHGISIHGVSAIVFFICLAIVAVALAKGRVRYITSTARRRSFLAAYDVAGFLMIAPPATIVAFHFLGHGGCESHWIFWGECLGIWAFSFFWFVKTLEYRLLLRIR